MKNYSSVSNHVILIISKWYVIMFFNLGERANNIMKVVNNLSSCGSRWKKKITVHPVFLWLEMKSSSLPRQHAVVPWKCLRSSIFNRKQHAWWLLRHPRRNTPWNRVPFRRRHRCRTTLLIVRCCRCHVGMRRVGGPVPSKGNKGRE